MAARPSFTAVVTASVATIPPSSAEAKADAATEIPASGSASGVEPRKAGISAVTQRPFFVAPPGTDTKLAA